MMEENKDHSAQTNTDVSENTKTTDQDVSVVMDESSELGITLYGCDMSSNISPVTDTHDKETQNADTHTVSSCKTFEIVQTSASDPPTEQTECRPFSVQEPGSQNVQDNLSKSDALEPFAQSMSPQTAEFHAPLPSTPVAEGESVSTGEIPMETLPEEQQQAHVLTNPSCLTVVSMPGCSTTQQDNSSKVETTKYSDKQSSPFDQVLLNVQEASLQNSSDIKVETIGSSGTERDVLMSEDHCMEHSTADLPQGPSHFDHSYKFSSSIVPQLFWQAASEFEQSGEDNFLRGCKWSPDGSNLVVNSNDNCLRVYKQELPTDQCSNTNTIPMKITQNCETMMREGSQIYDFCWLPQSSLDTQRVACTCSGIPIHLWDCKSGQKVASYRAYDQNDEITAACSISFSLDGLALFAGYKKAIRIFDTDRPGRSYKTIYTYTSKTKYGLAGIISCFAHSPDMSGMYAVGSYNTQAAIFDSRSNQMVCLMEGQRGGITHIQFSPDGSKLYTGGRKDPEIMCWDMRNPGISLFSMLRDVKTNQRMYFDQTYSGRYLCSGNHDGSVSVWDTLAPPEEVNGEAFLKPCCQFQAHTDCVNAISINSKYHVMATGSGQRHFQNFPTMSSDDSDSEGDRSEPSKDFSVKIWAIAHNVPSQN